ncbi:MAG TPA: glycoside hydrolase family 3 C-terminal domain-containing protein [Bacteroidales bacterium]|nr:glycoside hydrolase family 3 C-terminal domain-containing protein [Bacteroidales bacterium]
MKCKGILLVISAMIFISCSKETKHKSALLKYDQRIDTIISKMTLEEKIDMLHAKFMFVSSGVKRLGIADMIYTDGPFGIREEMEPKSWNPLGWQTDKATFFPTGSALAATWSPELAYVYGTGMAREARLRGKDMLLGPAINIQRIPTGGRTYEYLSEDPFLNSELAVGYIKGVQDNGVASCVKHYALNNQENNRGNVNVEVSERTMREIYLPAFRASVEDADVYGVMAAYNKVNGWWCAENDTLLNIILRKTWGFGGMVISDWGGTHSTVRSIENGLNVEMPGEKYLGKALLDSVKAGIVPESVIDQRVREILRVRLAIKPIPADSANKEITSQPAQQEIAYKIASKSIVLLKNDGILPLKLDKKPVIAVIGANATQTMATGGMGAGVKTLYEITPLEGLKNKIGDKANIVYSQGYIPPSFSFARMFRRTTPEQRAKEAREEKIKSDRLLREAVKSASKADIVLFIGGDNRAVETEGSDRRNIMLPAGQDSLLREISNVNQNIVTILASGAPNDLNVVQQVSKAIVISWFNGSEGGNALADILVGNISPGGRLPFTLPVKLEDSPAYALDNYTGNIRNRDVFASLVRESSKDSTKGKNEKDAGTDNTKDPNIAVYSEGLLVGYRWYDTKKVPVMYPFGYGLTYTTFEYASIHTDKDKYSPEDIIAVSFTLKNTGSVKADEVAQAYIHRIDPAISWPEKELKAFSRVSLDPGESKTVSISIPVKNLRYWDEKTSSWKDDPCNIEIQVGASADDIKLTKEVEIR